MKKEALDVMLEEMASNEDPHVDTVHNWLCNQEDAELETGILKEEKSIDGALKYVKDQAQKVVSNGMAMLEDEVVYGWVRDYFVKVEEKPKPSKKAKKKPKREVAEVELTLEDLL